MNCSLHVLPVEIERRELRLGERPRETEHVPQNREGVEDAVDVECGVDDQGRVEDAVPDVAARIGFHGCAWER